MFRFFMEFRILGFALGLGGSLIAGACDNLVLSQGTSAQPVDVSLQDIESGSAPESVYWNVGEHVAMTQLGVYGFSQPKGSTGEPTAQTRVTVYYYPIISKGHPYLAQASTPLALFGSVAGVPAQAWPAFEDFTVLVKTYRFATVGALPTHATEERQIQGMAINRIVRLSDQERKELSTLFPTLNLDRLLILEEGRTPATAIGSYSVIAGGSLVCLALPLWVWFQARRRSQDEGLAPEAPSHTFTR